MPRPKVLSGRDVVAIFEKLDFRIVSQRGSHVKLEREHAGSRQVLGVPLHREIDRGTLVAIYKQALQYVAEVELRPHFYNI